VSIASPKQITPTPPASSFHNPFITVDASRKQFANSLTVEQISQFSISSYLKWRMGPAASHRNSANSWCLSDRVKTIDQDFYCSMEGQETMKDDSH
jgi:hypothetical protein